MFAGRVRRAELNPTGRTDRCVQINAWPCVPVSAQMRHKGNERDVLFEMTVKALASAKPPAMSSERRSGVGERWH